MKAVVFTTASVGVAVVDAKVVLLTAVDVDATGVVVFDIAVVVAVTTADGAPVGVDVGADVVAD